MLDPGASRTALERLFTQRPVVDLAVLGRALGTDSRMSVFRRLSALGYLSSYTHTGRYYTLTSIPRFDADGLWRWEQVGFSRDGTLRATVRRLVETSEAGRTQRELQDRLGTRVHNPLLELVQSNGLRREGIGDQYVYVAANRRRAATQLERRRSTARATVPPAPSLEVEVLLEVIHGAKLPEADAAKVAAALAARGVRASVAEVAAVLDRHGLKKTPRSRLPRSSR
ncbi:MAG TPA: hypothetical protein VK433_01030 [Stellaceae bacterium]|nr:hypothetical protein [Stellaceae bacterium]